MQALIDEKSNLNPIISGSILPMTIKLSVPILIGHLLNLAYVIVDTLFISMLDSRSTAIMSSIGLVMPVHMLVIALGTGIFAGTGSLLARLLGEQQGQNSRSILASSFVLAALLGVILLLIFLPGGESILRLIAGDRITAETIMFGWDYLRFFLPGMFCLLLFFSLAGIAQGAGLVKYFALAMMVSTVCNIVLDPIFIFALGMGVKGAALASSGSIGLSLVLLYAKLKSPVNGLGVGIVLSSVRWKYLREISRIAIPQVLSLGVLSLGLMGLNFMVGSIGETHMNSWVLVGRMDELILIFGYAIGNATLTQVGQTFGSGDYLRLRTIYRSNLLLSILVGLVLAVLYNLLAYPLFSLFSSIDAVVAGSVFQVRVISFSFVGVLGLLVTNGMFQACGKAMPGLILNIFRIGVLILPFSYLLANRLNQGISSLFIVIVLGNIFTLLVAIVWSNHYLNRLANTP